MSFGPESILNNTFNYIDTIGTGGFGRAYLAKTKKDDKKVVIKEIDLSKMDKKMKEYIVREGFLLSLLEHPNIIDFKEYYYTRKIAYITMDYADGGDLDMKIKKQKKIDEKFPEEFVIQWFLEICEAIKYIHDQGVVHRDLKPKNIFLTEDGHVKLGDLGIAKDLSNEISVAKTAIGTQPYLSPEIIEGKPYNYSTDIWDLGVILYEMIELKHPFISLSPTKMFYNIINVKYEPIEDSQYQQQLIDLVPQFLKKEPKERINLSEVIKILKELQDTRKNNNNENEKYPDYYLRRSAIFKIHNNNNENNGHIRRTISKKYENGDKYDGEVIDDMKDGKGVMQYIGGNKYDGEWKNDKKEGKGTFIYKSGSQYLGEFKNNVKDGKGVFIYKNGDRYEGNFKNGVKSGKGIKYFKNGDKYDGDWEEDDFNGNGVFYYNNGNRYDGEFKGGVKEGTGTFFYADGKSKKGKWENDEFIEE